MANSVQRVALYARVSTSNGSQDPTMQTRELREYCERRGWQLVCEYVDLGISGAKEDRPELDRLWRMPSGGNLMPSSCGVSIVLRDRFSHLLRALENFNALGIDFISLSENIDTSTPTGKMIFTVLGAVAELERSLIVERVKAGLRNAKAKGVRLGRPRVFVSESKIEALRASGTPWRTIAKELGIGIGTARRASQARAKNRCGSFGTGIEGSNHVP